MTPPSNCFASQAVVRALSAALVVALGVAAARSAQAQSCHDSGATPGHDTFTLGMTVNGGISDFSPSNGFSGLGFNAGARYANAELKLNVPVYYLGQTNAVRFADLSAALGYAIAVSSTLRSLGVELDASLPTGDVDAGSGMGHVMLGPSLNAVFGLNDETSMQWTIGYATRIESGTAATESRERDQGVGTTPVEPGPSIDPRFHKELWIRPAFSFPIETQTTMHVSVLGALEAATWDYGRVGVDVGASYPLTHQWSLLGRAEYRTAFALRDIGVHSFFQFELGAEWMLD